MGLRLWRKNPPKSTYDNNLRLDRDPYGQEEDGAIFKHPIDDLDDLDRRERAQDMGERILYADRSFIITLCWAAFLILFPILQLCVVSSGRTGMNDGPFIAVVTTTTASVFGFWTLVGLYLFEPKSKSKKHGEHAKGISP